MFKKYSVFMLIVLLLTLNESVGYAKSASSVVCVDNDASKKSVEYLRQIMAKNGSACITQSNSDGTIEKGRLIWNHAKKCMRVEMNSGAVYLYSSSGLSIQEPGKDWTHVPLPNDWSRMLLEPEEIIKEKNAQAHLMKDGMYGLHLEEGGRFIYLFWSKNELKGWIIGSIDQNVQHNELAVDLQRIPTVTLPDSAWVPESSFLNPK